MRATAASNACWLLVLAACSTSPTAWSKRVWLACWRRRWAGVAGGPSRASKSSLSMPDMAVACHPHHRPAAPRPDKDPDARRRCPAPTASVPHRADRRPMASARPAAGRPALWPWPAGPPGHQPPRAGERDLYVLWTGCPWRALPDGYPHWRTVHHHFAHWAADGTLGRLHAVLRGRMRAAAGRTAAPTAAVIDAHSVRASD